MEVWELRVEARGSLCEMSQSKMKFLLVYSKPSRLSPASAELPNCFQGLAHQCQHTKVLKRDMASNLNSRPLAIFTS